MKHFWPIWSRREHQIYHINISKESSHMSDTLLRRCDASMWLHQFLGSFRAPTRQKQRARSAAMTYDWKKQQREKPPNEKEGGAAGGNDQKPFEQNVLKGTCALPLYVYCGSYLLGLLAMIKCSICSYQCDNWYVSNWRLDCHIYFWWGGAFLSLLRSPHVLHQNRTYLVAAHPLG